MREQQESHGRVKALYLYCTEHTLSFPETTGDENPFIFPLQTGKFGSPKSELEYRPNNLILLGWSYY